MPLSIDTEKENDLEDLQYDIEDTRKTDRWSDAPPEIKEIFHQLEWNIIDGEHTSSSLGLRRWIRSHQVSAGVRKPTTPVLIQYNPALIEL